MELSEMLLQRQSCKRMMVQARLPEKHISPLRFAFSCTRVGIVETKEH